MSDTQSDNNNNNVNIEEIVPEVPKPEPFQKKSLNEILEAACKRAIGGGVPGAIAMFLQVGGLMWLRTTMNYQYRHGTTTITAFRTLYSQGGIRRFYRGVLPALFQGPLSRFGDTAANSGVMALLDSYESTSKLPVSIKTATASFTAAMWRIFLMPIDTTKTILQVEGKKGLPMLKNKFQAGGPRILYHGAIGASSATFVGHYPWFYTYNKLEELLPKASSNIGELGRSALKGFCASVVSDTCSNSIRVLKTTKQTNSTSISYVEAAKLVISKDGIIGLFGRGLQTRILANGIQGLVFSVLWTQLQKALFPDFKK